MSDDDSLYFSFDDQEEPEEEDQAQAEEGQNKSFLYGIIALGAVFVLTLCLGVGYLAFRPQIEQMLGGQGQVSGNQATNEFNMTAYAITQTAQAQLMPTEPLEPIVSPTTLASSTPTSGVELTVIGTATVEGTLEGTLEGTQQVAEITPAGTQTVTTPGAGTQIAQITPAGTVSAAAPTSGVSGLVTPTRILPTSSIIEVTPIGGGGATPTRAISGIGGTAAPGTTPVATGVGGPIQPTVQSTLPSTGFAGSAGLLGAGFLAIVLVAVVVVVRRIRLQ
jgi:hypothetical protein